MSTEICVQYESRIWAAVDGDGVPDDQNGLGGHVRTCPTCQRTLQQAVRTHRRLAERALLPLSLDAFTGTASASPIGSKSGMQRARPRISSRRKAAKSATATPFIATGAGILLVALLALGWQQRPAAATPTPSPVEVAPMPEKTQVIAAPPLPAFKLELGNSSPVTVIDGKVLRWGSAKSTGHPPIGKQIDGQFALCLDGVAQGMESVLPAADLSRGFALLAVVHSTNVQNQSCIAALMGPAGETAALLWTTRGPAIRWAQDPASLSAATQWNNRDRFVIAWRCAADGRMELLTNDGDTASGRVAQAARSALAQTRTLAIAQGDGLHFQGNVFAIELLSPAPSAPEMRQRLHSLASLYQATIPVSESLP